MDVFECCYPDAHVASERIRGRRSSADHAAKRCKTWRESRGIVLQKLNRPLRHGRRSYCRSVLLSCGVSLMLETTMDGGTFGRSFLHARQLSDVVRSSAVDGALCTRGTFGRSFLHARQLSDVVLSSDVDGALCPRDGVRDGMCPRDVVRDDGGFQRCHSVSRVD